MIIDSENMIIGITMGDPAGIGPEIIVKYYSEKSNSNPNIITFVLGHYLTFKNIINKIGLNNLKINVLDEFNVNKFEKDCVNLIEIGNDINIIPEFGKISEIAGELSFRSIKKAIELALEDKINAVVTAPINKRCLNLSGYNFSGHTEIFAYYTNTKKYCMLLASDKLKVAHVTTHVSLSDAIKKINKERIIDVIILLHEALKKFGFNEPKIGVAGLNPHAGEDGLFGNEEQFNILPAIQEAKSMNINVEGPLPADTLFPLAAGGKFDGCVAMYHDQGHIPFKLLDFQWDEKSNKMIGMEGVNITLGLPFVRTSVDHGTAYEIAGKGIANHNALKKAIEYAIMLSSN